MASPAPQTMRPADLSRVPCVHAALEWIAGHADWITDRQIDLIEIPAPPFGEALRARALRDLLESSGWTPRIDREGNVVAELPAARDGDGDVVLVSAHLDTAMVPTGPVQVRREGSRLLAPGITDNGAGLAALVALASAFRAASIRTGLGVVFAGNVGEEGEGNLRGIRSLVADYGRRLKSVIVIDGASPDRIATAAIASRRIEVAITGPGGHSWADAGVPNPIHALGRAISRMVSVPLSADPLSTLNVTVVQGGTAINAIPSRASIKIDLRSESEAELDRLETEVRRAVDLGALAERESARRSAPALAVEFHRLGARPAGRLSADSPLLGAIREVDRHLGIHAECQAASTDANVPLSLGIPAVCVGGGGTGGRAHSAEEWYDPAGRQIGVQRLLLTLLFICGVGSGGGAGVDS
ncbi:MAG TPA: M20/M25/M40 family metallo-hydrolase [Candidatus Dormibacteraeota bacterium]|nr:M20/M25/M40 family metallo-hydrolase [Candidatus Dormibacteraeota bacterium]